MATWSQLNTNVQNQCGPQLRTFSVSYNMATAVYTYASGGPSSGTTTHNTTLTHSDGGGPYSTSNNDLASRIYTGSRIYDEDVQNSFANCVRGTVDRIEAVTGNHSYGALVCHTSCHTYGHIHGQTA